MEYDIILELYKLRKYRHMKTYMEVPGVCLVVDLSAIQYGYIEPDSILLIGLPRRLCQSPHLQQDTGTHSAGIPGPS